jgi:Ferredoxin
VLIKQVGYRYNLSTIYFLINFMANITFSSPLLPKDITVYAVAGDTHTLLKVAQKNKIPLPFECEDGQCGSCVMEVQELSDKPFMAQSLTEKERATLLAAGKLTKGQIEEAVVNDRPPPVRLACQFIVRHEDILVRFSGEPGVL